MKNLILALFMCLVLAGVAAAAVNINTASKEELTSLKGIGDKRAQEIIDYRKKNGDFKSVDDLEKVPGIGPGIMKQIRSQVSVSGKTTADKPSDKAKAVEQTKAKAPDPAKSKGAEAKKADAPKGDAMKADKAKEKVAETSKADDKKTEKK